MAYTTITRLIFLVLWGFLIVTMWFFGRFSPVEQFKEQQIRINEVLEFPWSASANSTYFGPGVSLGYRVSDSFLVYAG